MCLCKVAAEPNTNTWWMKKKGMIMNNSKVLYRVILYRRKMSCEFNMKESVAKVFSQWKKLPELERKRKK